MHCHAIYNQKTLHVMGVNKWIRTDLFDAFIYGIVEAEKGEIVYVGKTVVSTDPENAVNGSRLVP